MNIDKAREILTDFNLRAVSEKSGVEYMTLYRFVHGATVRPSYDTVSRVERYLKDLGVLTEGES